MMRPLGVCKLDTLEMLRRGPLSVDHEEFGDSTGVLKGNYNLQVVKIILLYREGEPGPKRKKNKLELCFKAQPGETRDYL